MKNAVFATALVALLAPACADEFRLTDGSGKSYGPFEFKEGSKLSIAGAEYTIAKVLTKELRITERMKSIIVPELDFRQADVRDVISCLQVASVEFDRTVGGQRGVSLVLNLATSPAAAAQPADASANDPVAAMLSRMSRASEAPLVTFSAHEISLHDAINVICRICDLKWSVENSVVMIVPKLKDQKVQQTNAPYSSPATGSKR